VSWAAPAFLFTAAALVLFTAGRTEAALLAVCGALGWLAEVVGVRTGLPFGGYAYTDVLGSGWAGVPFAMAAAWMLLASYGRFMAAALGLRGLVLVAVGAAWMVGMDMVIDPLAGGVLAYWTWEKPGAYYGVPASNFLGWYAVSAVLLGLLARLREPASYHGAVGMSLLLFFTILAATRGLMVAALAGCGLVAVHAAASTWCYGRSVRAGISGVRRPARNNGPRSPGPPAR
jgi:putative membrane protein